MKGLYGCPKSPPCGAYTEIGTTHVCKPPRFDEKNIAHALAIDWTAIEAGTTLTKFIAVDRGAPEGDYSVELHGLVDKNGNILIVESKVLQKELEF